MNNISDKLVLTIILITILFIFGLIFSVKSPERKVIDSPILWKDDYSNISIFRNYKSYPERIYKWRAGISNVPQKLYLNNASIAENIAFGESLKEINILKVKEAAKKAEIHQYISKQPLNYFSKIGENGIKLSGGQRQRIGLARAFYKSSEIIVLDEATSALDTFTESKIIDTVFKSSKNITIILVTHRENSIKACDKVVRISKDSQNLINKNSI